jgi:predicted HTH transcriptional regulator
MKLCSSCIDIGIENSGEAAGVRDKYLELTRIDKALTLLIPRPDIAVQSVTFKNVEIMILEIHEGKNKPYFVHIDGKPYAFIRSGAENVHATKKELKTLMNRTRILSTVYKNLNQDEKILFDLFEQERRLGLSQIREKLSYTERQMKKAIANLYKLGLIVPSLSDREIYYRTDHT